MNLCRFTKNSVGLGQNIKIEKSAGKPVIHDNRNFNVRLYQGLKTFKTLSGYPLRVEEQRKKRKGYKRYDKNTIHLPRQHLPQHHGPVRFYIPGGAIRHGGRILY